MSGELDKSSPNIVDVDWDGRACPYDADYFLRGKETGKSLYTAYRWLPDLTIPMVCAMIRHLEIAHDASVLDFGCARGYVVRAFREMGYNAWGYDVSRWAIENADESVREWLICNESALFGRSFDWVIAKDVLEHVKDLDAAVDLLMDCAVDGVFAVVPLSHNAMTYDVADYDLDVTHVHRRPLSWWVSHFHRPGWSVEGCYRVRGVKDNYAEYPTGNGFIVARRLEG